MSGGLLEGSRALVTGGGSGLGRAIVARFVTEGARVAVLERDVGKAEQLSADFGDVVTVTVGDVTRYDDNQRAVTAAVEVFGGLDTFVGNAGIWDWNVTLEAHDPDTLPSAFAELFGINVGGYLLGAKAALPALRESRGSMIFTSSNAAFDPAGGGPLYTASKFAVRGLVTQLAHELAPVVRVNGVAPGGIRTDLRGPASLGLENQSLGEVPGFEEIVAAASPLGVLPDASDYTGPYVLLAARSQSSTITGTVIRADGGIGVRGFPTPSQPSDRELETVP